MLVSSHFQMIIWKKKPHDLVELIPKEVLPSEYGGDLKSTAELKGTTSEDLMYIR